MNGPAAARPIRALLLLAAGACAACALVYELALIALGGVLVGATVTQTSLVVSLFVFALGLGALAAKPLLKRPLPAFVAIEVGVAVAGGFSVLACYAAFAYAGVYTPAVVVASLLVGGLVGAELPILMELLQRIRKQAAARALADLTAADYVGALVGGLAFPFVLLPLFGQMRGALAAGLVNLVCAALIVFVVFRGDLSRRLRVGSAAVLLVGALAVVLGLAYAGRFEVSARQQLYDDPIVVSERTPYQEIDLTESLTVRGTPDVRLYLNGDLQLSSRDEYRYHEALVHPVLAATSAAARGRGLRVLVLGGGDGMAVREVLRRRDVASVHLVDLDPAMTRLARTDPRLRSLNRGSLDDRRVRVTNTDAFNWVRDHEQDATDDRYDAVIVDFPDPDDQGLARLYSAELYGMVRTRVLAPGGVAVVQSGSPYFAPDAFWSVGRTLQLGGWRARPYHVDVPTFGDWGFWLAGPADGSRPAPALTVGNPAVPGLRFLDEATLRAAATFPADRGPRDVRPTTLNRPAILDYTRRGWADY
ncbi:polyamine aminopropyltransferase [Patulibacter sp.]|uniref:polyamine aminopropyltransferase n=1 Tax=Patulibacter sp. TaxID=1912859 RepID=UPI00271BE5CA|nr:polyamine aminopropyltransferase [Patulibacter sp.]MDO9409437.1 polyamine aminopropyltransferase [Patulibacter sp.]